MRRITVTAASIAILIAGIGPFGATARAAFPGDDGLIAYSSIFPSTHIFMMHDDGTNVVAITPTDWVTAAPVWSPNGRAIAFVRSRANGTGDALMTANADGSSPTIVVPFAAPNTQFIVSVSWSPNGSTLAFCGETESPSGVFTVGANGVGLTKISDGTHVDCDPAWSPDGSLIAMDSHLKGSNLSRIVTVHPDGTGRTVLVRSGFNYYPDWSPDGTHLAFARAFGRGNYDIFAVHADGTVLTNITHSPNIAEWTPAYSPSGTRIVYSREQGRGFTVPDDLWVTGAHGFGTPERLTDTPQRDEWDPSWQPAGVCRGC